MRALYPLPQALLPGNPNEGTYTVVARSSHPENFFLARIDYNISEKDSLFGRYQFDFGDRTTYGGLGLWPTYDVTHNQFLTLGERHIFSPNLVNQFTASYSRPVTSETRPTTHDALQVFTPARQDVYITMPNGISPLGSSFINPFQYLENKFTEKDDVTWIRGSHTISMGLSARRDQLNPTAYTYWNGDYIFTSLQNFLGGIPYEFVGAPNGGTNATRGIRTISLNPYIQDDWRVNKRLTLNIGLRYSWESNPVEVNNLLHNVVGPPFGDAFRTCRMRLSPTRPTGTLIRGSGSHGTCSAITKRRCAPDSGFSMTCSRLTRSPPPTPQTHHS